MKQWLLPVLLLFVFIEVLVAFSAPNLMAGELLYVAGLLCLVVATFVAGAVVLLALVVTIIRYAMLFGILSLYFSVEALRSRSHHFEPIGWILFTLGIVPFIGLVAYTLFGRPSADLSGWVTVAAVVSALGILGIYLGDLFEDVERSKKDCGDYFRRRYSPFLAFMRRRPKVVYTYAE
jgi:hypothetical protein